MISLSSLISGQRGSGKTAFMTDVCNKLSSDSSWLVVNVPPTEQFFDILIASMAESDALKKEKVISKIKGLSVSAGFISLEYEKTQSPVALVTLKELLSVVAKKGLRLLSETLTFLLRAGRVDLAALDLLEIRMAYEESFETAGRKISREASVKMAQMTGGYAYAFQLLGYLVWEEKKDISKSLLEKVSKKYKALLFRNAYSKIYEGLTPVQKQILIAVARGGDKIDTSKLINITKKSSGYVSVYRKSLIDQNILYAPSRGQLKFMLPYFGEYVLDREELQY